MSFASSPTSTSQTGGTAFPSQGAASKGVDRDWTLPVSTSSRTGRGVEDAPAPISDLMPANGIMQRTSASRMKNAHVGVEANGDDVGDQRAVDAPGQKARKQPIRRGEVVAWLEAGWPHARDCTVGRVPKLEGRTGGPCGPPGVREKAWLRSALCKSCRESSHCPLFRLSAPGRLLGHLSTLPA